MGVHPAALAPASTMTPPTFDGLVTFVFAPDLDAAHAFYHDVVGLELALDQGPCRIYRVATGAWLGVCTHDDHAPNDGVIVTLVTDDVDGVWQRLVDRGVETDGAPRMNERFGIYHFFTRDPAGWRVEVQRFVDSPLPGIDPQR